MFGFLTNLSIRMKISLIAAVAVLGFSTSLFVNYQASVKNVEQLNRIETVNFPIADFISECRLALGEIKKLFNNAVTASEASMVTEDAVAQADIINNALSQINKLDSENHYNALKTQQLFQQYYNQASQMTLSMIDGSINYDTLGDQIDSINSLYSELDKTLKEIHHQDKQDFVDALKAAKQNSQDSLQTGLIIGIFVVFLTLSITLVVANKIHTSLTRLSHSLHNLAQGGGDLTQRIETKDNDEIGAVVDEFNSFTKKLREIIAEVVTAASILKVSTSAVATEAGNTQDGMNLQTKEINEITSAFDAMQKATTDIAEHAASAAQNAEQAVEQTKQGCAVLMQNKQSAERLNQSMTETNNTMAELAAESESIGAVLEVIRGVAEQTNLLALNAAIEAARAGEQGRGFAVVADEVRTLAGRTQQSTAEIHEIISSLQNKARTAVSMVEQSQEQVQQSSKTAEDADAIFQNINQAVAEITQANFSMASASEEQSVVAEQVGASLHTISSTTSSTKDSACLVTSNSKDLSLNSDNLEKLVSRFNV